MRVFIFLVFIVIISIFKIVNLSKFDKMSTYGRMTPVGEIFMKNTFQKKARAVIVGSLLISMVAMIPGFAVTELDLSASEFKQITVCDEGRKEVLYTKANNFIYVLNDLKKPLQSHDKYWTTTSDIQNGSVLYIERAVPVTIIENDISTVIYTTQQTVQGAVNDAGYDWRKMMPLEDGFLKIHKNMKIHVVPYMVRTVEKIEDTPKEYVRWYDDSLGADETIIVEECIPGKRKVEVEEFLSNGEVIKQSTLRSEIIQSGTKGVVKTGNREGAVGWVTTMNATAYHPSDGGGEGITATGTRAGYGTVAVDPNVIPLGSKVYIPQYGDAIAADTGGAIKGKKIDLCMESYDECYQFGRRDIQVFVSY